MESTLADMEGTLDTSYTMNVDYRDRIVIESGVRSGKPVVKGTRMTVYDVLGYLSAGTTEAELLVDFPQLAHEDVMACLAFAADRERRIDSGGN